MKRFFLPAPFFLLCSPLLRPAARAADWFLTIGGGTVPQKNQIALERNVLFFQRVLAGAGLGDARQDAYFANGPDDVPDVQFSKEPPRANLLLGRLMTDNDHDIDRLYFCYQRHAIPNLSGPATRAAVKKWFDAHADKIKEGDRLLIYFTGHGGGGPKPALRNTNFTLWAERPMDVREFAGLLDQLNGGVRVVLVMAQCHAGGFADVIFEHAVPGPKLSPTRRCGFFAAPFDRVASGCTPEISEETYQDYTTHFFAALGGKTRTGVAVKLPEADLDADGKISLAEAHAYALIHADTSDLPVCTSDVFLRQFSKTRDPALKDLLSTSSPIQELFDRAGSPDKKAVLERLGRNLGLKATDPATSADKAKADFEGRKKKVEQEQQKLTQERERLRKQMRERLLRRFPEYASAYHPAAVAALADPAKAAELVKAVEADSDYKRWDEVDRQIEALDGKSTKLEADVARCQRFLYAAETAALAANLDRVVGANQDVRDRYQSLREAENGFLKE